MGYYIACTAETDHFYDNRKSDLMSRDREKIRDISSMGDQPYDHGTADQCRNFPYKSMVSRYFF